LRQARGGSKILSQARQYSTKTAEIKKSKTRGRVILVATGALLGAGAIAFKDDARHVYQGAQRSGRVLSALAVCINE
jgi:aarF domain-containing kinase